MKQAPSFNETGLVAFLERLFMRVVVQLFKLRLDASPVRHRMSLFPQPCPHGVELFRVALGLLAATPRAASCRPTRATDLARIADELCQSLVELLLIL